MTTLAASFITCSMAALIVVMKAVGVEPHTPYIIAGSFLGAGIFAGCCARFDKRPRI